MDLRLLASLDPSDISLSKHSYDAHSVEYVGDIQTENVD